ncbi:hypothetical protein [Candidatus Chazhemtobacterium aquaticus]|uniref:Thioredoxin domain-containing protein n=1 Tax=Candidatus Chazhemtobacterium aquaticus TaxID=2715735 RepID=A0A857NC57_9BACT|nr:hypothetical protein [Candidatus Chazhemtobacterium aquaticus]QHO63121.1 hypothetical protein MICH65_0140 [Candidatus Chazhemtobacterium aquaticus]
MMKRLLVVLFGLFLWMGLSGRVLAGEVGVYFFWGEGCPHCAKEKIFLDKLERDYEEVRVYEFEITRNQANVMLLQEMARDLDVEVAGVPFTVVGRDYWIGYQSEATTGKEIEAAVIGLIEEEGEAIGSEEGEADKGADEGTGVTIERMKRDGASIEVPILGEVEIEGLSLPVLTVVMAVLDGFNPCAMWTLLFLISLLLGMENRRRMWILGVTFVATSAGVYFLFLSAWLNLFLFVGMVGWIRGLIGLVAVGAGGYYLWDFCVNREGGCGVMGDEKRQKVFEKLKGIVLRQRFWMALMGIVLLAVAVNMVELVCSAGLPAVYTQILSMSELSSWQYYMYLVFYVLIFMLDDLFVFFTAMITLRAVGIESKYARYSHLIGGGLMLVLGLLLWFKPEVLMFG